MTINSGNMQVFSFNMAKEAHMLYYVEKYMNEDPEECVGELLYTFIMSRFTLKYADRFFNICNSILSEENFKFEKRDLFYLVYILKNTDMSPVVPCCDILSDDRMKIISPKAREMSKSLYMKDVELDSDFFGKFEEYVQDDDELQVIKDYVMKIMKKDFGAFKAAETLYDSFESHDNFGEIFEELFNKLISLLLEEESVKEYYESFSALFMTVSDKEKLSTPMLKWLAAVNILSICDVTQTKDIDKLEALDLKKAVPITIDDMKKLKTHNVYFNANTNITFSCMKKELFNMSWEDIKKDNTVKAINVETEVAIKKKNTSVNPKKQSMKHTLLGSGDMGSGPVIPDSVIMKACYKAWDSMTPEEKKDKYDNDYRKFKEENEEFFRSKEANNMISSGSVSRHKTKNGTDIPTIDISNAGLNGVYMLKNSVTPIISVDGKWIAKSVGSEAIFQKILDFNKAKDIFSITTFEPKLYHAIGKITVKKSEGEQYAEHIVHTTTKKGGATVPREISTKWIVYDFNTIVGYLPITWQDVKDNENVIGKIVYLAIVRWLFGAGSTTIGNVYVKSCTGSNANESDVVSIWETSFSQTSCLTGIMLKELFDKVFTVLPDQMKKIAEVIKKNYKALADIAKSIGSQHYDMFVTKVRIIKMKLIEEIESKAKILNKDVDLNAIRSIELGINSVIETEFDS